MRKLLSAPAGLISFCLAAVILLIACGREPDNRDTFFHKEAIRVLILSGRNNHEWRKSTPFLKDRLLETGLFDVRIEEEPAGITANTLAPYDLLVIDYCGPRWGAVTEKAVEDFVSSGKGLVAVHGANYTFGELELLGDNHVRTGIREMPWDEYVIMVGGTWVEGPPKTAHGERHSFKVRFTDREHPVAAGMAESFIATDELYGNPKLMGSAKVIATAFSDTATGGTGKDEPMLWTVNYGKGRTFYTALGHNLAAMSESGFITTFLRGCEWAATGKVTLPPEISYYSRQPDTPRALVVTGGHDYQSEFYSLFEGGWLTWDHAVSSTEAFAKDIRESYDVLVLYDLSRELDDKGKQNLRDFVESGKGVVILHHAIADYTPSWPWWYEEVVGGRYILEAEKEHSASTYLHDVELFVKPVGRHPVTAAVGAMHLRDETYKGMWISPGVNVILSTDEVTSDGPLAWISPWEKSRVIYIQLGHDRQAFLYPGYRELVKRAVLWSAGRLE